MWIKRLLFLSWTLFVICLGSLSWSSHTPFFWAMAVCGVLATGASFAWWRKSDSWIYPCLLLSVVNVLLFLLRYGVMAQVARSDNEGVGTGVEKVAFTTAAYIRAQFDGGEFFYGLVSIYWMVAMPVFQLFFAALLIRSIRHQRVQTAT